MEPGYPRNRFEARGVEWLEAGWGGGCQDRLGTGPPRARTQVIYVDLSARFDTVLTEGDQNVQQVTINVYHVDF